MHNLAINNLSIPGVPKLSTKPSTLFMVRFYINRSFGIVGMAYDLYSLDRIPLFLLKEYYGSKESYFPMRRLTKYRMLFF